MQLEKVTAEIRPRDDREAVDLGLALARRDFWRLWGIWWAMSAPAFGLLVVMTAHPFWWLILWWWWKPQASRMVLYYLSRRLFGERPGWRELAREARRGSWRTFGRRMLWGRLSLRRLLSMPIEELEGLKGPALKMREAALMQRGGSGAAGLSLTMGLLTVWLTGALLLLWLQWLLPEGQSRAWSEAWDLWRASEGTLPPPLIVWTSGVAFALAVSIVDIFAVAAGFGVYLNHRSWLEGWDVELVFKRLAERLRSMGMAAAVMLAAVGGWGGAEAAGGPSDEGWQVLWEQGQTESGSSGGTASLADEKEVIRDVLAHEDFKVHTKKFKVLKSRSRSEGSWEFLGPVLELIGWVFLAVAVAAVVGLIVWLIYRYHHLLGGSGGKKPPGKKRKRTGVVVSGLEIRGEELPDDPPGVAARLWSDGRKREALAMLYRAAISWLVEHRQLELGESVTEYDCVRRVATADAGSAAYFRRLTDAWVMLAYGARVVSDEEAGHLCRSWPFRSGGQR